MTLAQDIARVRDNPGKAWALAKRALNQWLDAPDDRVARPLFVVGCQRSGTTMLLDTLMRAPDLWVHPEKSSVAYDAFRLRSPGTIDLVTRLTPAAVAIYKPLCDSHLVDRMLAHHDNATAIWLVRRWEDVARSSVAKWGAHHLDIVRAVSAGLGDTVGWRGERVPEELVAQLAELVSADTTAEEGAALFWYLRNSFFFALGLDEEPRMQLLRYEDLVLRPAPTFEPVFRSLGVGWEPDWVADVVSSSVSSERPAIDPRIASLCDALQERFDTAALMIR